MHSLRDFFVVTDRPGHFLGQITTCTCWFEHLLPASLNKFFIINLPNTNEVERENRLGQSTQHDHREQRLSSDQT
jgi:hypothetical protein